MSQWARAPADAYGNYDRDVFYIELHSDPNQPPTAVAGEDQSIRAGDFVELDGSDSSDDNTASESLDYAWSFLIKPEGSIASLDDAGSVTPTFTTDVIGTYILELIVTDEDGASSVPDYVTISSDNLAPTAVANADTYLFLNGETVNFDGFDSSDPENDELTYSWRIVEQPFGSVATLEGAVTPMPSLTTDVEGTYVVELTVADFLGPGLPVELEVNATNAVEFAEYVIMECSDFIGSLSEDQIPKKGHKKKLQKELKKAMKEIQKGHFHHAIKALEKVVKRTDGYPLRGEVDEKGKSRDWVIDPDAQTHLYECLTLAIETLE